MEPLSQLFDAVHRDDPAAAREALAAGAEVGQSSGLTPLHHAGMWDAVEVARVLLEHGADPNAQRVDNLEAPIHYAAIGTNIGKNANGCDGPGTRVAELLLDSGADPNLLNSWAPPFHALIEKRSIGWRLQDKGVLESLRRFARRLLERGADPHGRDYHGSTPLHWAAILGDPVLVKLVLAAGADPAVRNKRSWTALDLADAYGNREAATLLVGRTGSPG